MPTLFITIAVGILLIVLGISNIKGNINSIHSYHRHRVSKEDKPVFGKLMGTGTIICGIGILAFALLFAIGYLSNQTIFTTIGSYLTVIGLIIGIGIMTYATIKYNKGIF